MKLDLSQPKTAFTVIAGVVVFLVVLPNLDKGWAVLRYMTDAFPTAYAGKATADETKDRFDQYIQQQQQAIETQNKIAEAIAGYTQQQQAPQQVYRQMPDYPQPNTFIEGPANEGLFWCCRAYDYEQCFEEDENGYDLWMQCDPDTKGL